MSNHLGFFVVSCCFFNLLHCVLSTDIREKHIGIKGKPVSQNTGRTGSVLFPLGNL